MPVRDVSTDDVLKVLEPIWTTKEETARRLRSRVERILDYASAREWRDGDNPARWQGHLKDILPKRDKTKMKNFASMPYEILPIFISKISSNHTIPSLALRFAILTAARTGEVLEATWSEIDFDETVWVIPAERMKAKQEHVVPLSNHRLMLLSEAELHRVSEYIFPGAKKRRPLSNMSMSMLLRRTEKEKYTVHGFRSTFRDWCGDKTKFPREVAEAALAHKVGNKVEQAYRRRSALEKRRHLMDMWSKYCFFDI